ncbi:hypothetical protein QJS66_20965 [Kocuria rhizophila]|nr:hypothetical protein QJS66_20965 [Kocuria rhizophila]
MWGEATPPLGSDADPREAGTSDGHEQWLREQRPPHWADRPARPRHGFRPPHCVGRSRSERALSPFSGSRCRDE